MNGALGKVQLFCDFLLSQQIAVVGGICHEWHPEKYRTEEKVIQSVITSFGVVCRLSAKMLTTMVAILSGSLDNLHL
jgi:hypothetical protein